jgi:hypothetical protein
MTVQDLQFMGFGGWVDLARYLKRNDLEKFEVIRMPKNRMSINAAELMSLTDDQCWVFTPEEIKARAFDELFSALPLTASVQLIQEAIRSERAESINYIMSFISKIPTRDL